MGGKGEWERRKGGRKEGIVNLSASEYFEVVQLGRTVEVEVVV